MLSSPTRLVDSDEAAQMLHVSPGTLAVWRCRQTYPLAFVKVGRSVRYRLEDLHDFVSRRTNPGCKEACNEKGKNERSAPGGNRSR